MRRFNLIKTVKPKNKTYVCFDGVPPYAKMNQQRQRRFKGSLTNKILNKEPSSWNRNQITPGSLFMNDLDSYLINKFSKEPKIVFSPSSEPGEGEHKLFEYLRKNKNTEDNIALYGLDSDLIMLSICHLTYCNNIYIFREAPEFIKSSFIRP